MVLVSLFCFAVLIATVFREASCFISYENVIEEKSTRMMISFFCGSCVMCRPFLGRKVMFLFVGATTAMISLVRNLYCLQWHPPLRTGATMNGERWEEALFIMFGCFSNKNGITYLFFLFAEVGK